ncbi:hypothetical protein SAMN02744133_10815 [Thalassospira xiamenensis M-5 = DSM 17429]|uniref:Uncharacterized protein n=1 Tax=Thalassospira xiamenensis M-5 = DSM 17429 TaxID=1123366 RepID=A0AB72UJB6_9PROT|nr:hypothetical protein TH3_21113 [Thalassospira xiamenensis M-5 = DSM 17429]SIT20901.1 hypothetical protein SAMN02744133_10815 [Thalassospira xiamenensis M-5 = DSM 17429]
MSNSLSEEYSRLFKSYGQISKGWNDLIKAKMSGTEPHDEEWRKLVAAHLRNLQNHHKITLQICRRFGGDNSIVKGTYGSD